MGHKATFKHMRLVFNSVRGESSSVEIVGNLDSHLDKITVPPQPLTFRMSIPRRRLLQRVERSLLFVLFVTIFYISFCFLRNINDSQKRKRGRGKGRKGKSKVSINSLLL